MTPRLSSHISIFCLVFLVLRSDFLELPDNRVVKKGQFCPLNLIYQTWAISRRFYFRFGSYAETAGDILMEAKGDPKPFLSDSTGKFM